MELRQLEYFIAVAEQLNFSRAAEQLYVSQPLLSQQIAELEEEFGVSLFSRTRKSVKLTDAGVALLQEARGIMESVNVMKRVVIDAANGIGTGAKLQIGYEQVFDRTVITRATFGFREKYPLVDCTLTTMSYAELIYAVREGECDVGFTLLPNESIGQHFHRLTVGLDTLTMIAARPLAPKEFNREFVCEMVSRYPIYGIDHDSKGVNSMINVLTALNLTPQFVFVESVTDIVINVESGAGIAFLPLRRVKELTETGIAAYPLTGYQDAGIELTAIWSKHNTNPQIKMFLDEVNSLDI